MKCKKCKGEWTPPANITITKCPFCGEHIIKATSVNKEIELHDLLLEIVNQYEKNILGEMRLHALLSDLKPNIEKHHKSIIKQVLQDKVGNKLLQLEQESEATRVIKIDTIKDSFKTNNAYNETADYIVDCFLFSLGWLSNIDKQQYKPKATVDTEVMFNQQIEMAFIDKALSKSVSAQLFVSGKQLGLSDDEIADIIEAKIKVLKFNPSTTIDKLQSKKEIICSCDWHFELNQTKEQDIKYGSFTDERDGKQYKTVKIGNQVWLAENLAYTGSGEHITNDSKWAKNKDFDGWCYYKNNEDYGKKYGVLYQFEAAKIACPSGWHIPTDNEWNELEKYLCNNGNSGTEGAALKSISSWYDSGNGNDDYGFAALPGSHRIGNNGAFYNVGKYGFWWGSIEYSDNPGHGCGLGYQDDDIGHSEDNKLNGFSVRCVRDQVI